MSGTKVSRTSLSSDIDLYVAARLRGRRTALGLSQKQLATLVGVTLQQAHRYECGLTQISAGRLFKFAEVLTTPVSWFFEGVTAPGNLRRLPDQRMALELARNFMAVADESRQEALTHMARSLAIRSLKLVERAAIGTNAPLRDRP